jgi:HEPN domain-containing protein
MARERIGARDRANRAPDRLAQAAYDLQHARHAAEDGDYDWACFAAHQAAVVEALRQQARQLKIQRCAALPDALRKKG